MCSIKHNPKRKILLILTFFILHLSAEGGFFTANATVRYVSHSGSNMPPYTSWATAADSIMSAINISVFGDTIYVANGTYYEKVVMIDGLTLIGSGMDSCVIDTRVFTGTVWSIQTNNYCVLEGFKIISSDGISSIGTAVFMQQSFSTKLINNKIESASIGIKHSNQKCVIEKNIISNVDYGIYSSDYPTTPLGELIISQNYIQAAEKCLYLHSPNYIRILINNNFLYANAVGIEEYGISVDTVKMYNNLIIGGGILTLGNIYSIINNYVTGSSGTGIMAFESTVKNNVVTDCYRGIMRGLNNYPLTMQYNNLWENQINYDNVIPDSTNLSVDPMVANESTRDFHLQMYSPLIDAGDSNILDVDGSRSDIGLFGGPYGESYTYLDLAPRSPVNLIADVDSNFITVSWNHNTEADFNNYSLFRDTTVNFTADSTTFVLSLTDTFYTHIIPEGVEALFYKLTATDNQGNQSSPSEELAVMLTSINEHPITINDYKLYQNYPNPFNPSTKIGYRLKVRGYVKLYVYDIKGELIEVLVNQFQDAGYYEVEFNGEGKVEMLTVKNPFASGFYICQIIVQNEKGIPVFSDMKKMILLK